MIFFNHLNIPLYRTNNPSALIRERKLDDSNNRIIDYSVTRLFESTDLMTPIMIEIPILWNSGILHL